MACKHKRVFVPPLAKRPWINGRQLRAEDIICAQCVEDSRKEFLDWLRVQSQEFWERRKGSGKANG